MTLPRFVAEIALVEKASVGAGIGTVPGALHETVISVSGLLPNSSRSCSGAVVVGSAASAAGTPTVEATGKDQAADSDTAGHEGRTPRDEDALRLLLLTECTVRSGRLLAARLVVMLEHSTAFLSCDTVPWRPVCRGDFVPLEPRTPARDCPRPYRVTSTAQLIARPPGFGVQAMTSLWRSCDRDVSRLKRTINGSLLGCPNIMERPCLHPSLLGAPCPSASPFRRRSPTSLG